MDRTIFRIATMSVVAAAYFIVAACSSSGNNSTATPVPPPPAPDPVTSNAYNGPGSKWDVSLNDDNTFEITRQPDIDAAVDLTVNGTWQRNAMGFVLLTVDSASGTDAPNPGDVAWAVEAEGYALMLETEGNNFTPMIKSGACPEADMAGNWVIVRKHEDADATEVDGDYFGSFAFDAMTGVANLPDQHSLSDGFPATGSSGELSAGTCADGIMEVDDAVMYLADNGGAIVHTNLSQPSETSFIFALAQKAVTSVAALDAEYAGILFDGSSAADDRISAVSIACTGGLCSGSIVDDVVAMTTSGSFSIDLFGTTNAPVSGFLTGSVADELGNTGNLACMIDENVQGSGQRLVSCVGQAPAANQKMFNLLFASNQ
ncbi:MAG: hypothetical protein KJO31_05525 [Gammaproteobacteria bacterium]|nr:hypothetical protein [Gammaproteobacteria bacterium]